MQHRAFLLLVLLFGAAPLQGQRTEVIRRTPGDSIRNTYRVHEPSGTPKGLLVLLPGYGSDVDGFAPSSYTPSTLPARMAKQNVLTIVAVPEAETLYETDEPLRLLDSIIAEVLQKYRIPKDRVVIGGFSSGGTGAIRYAQFCAQGRCKAGAQGGRGVRCGPAAGFRSPVPQLRSDGPAQGSTHQHHRRAHDL